VFAGSGSNHSSPSKAGSLAPLLRSPAGGFSPVAGGGLLKFPSGMSAGSSHDNPVFETASDASYTPAGRAGFSSLAPGFDPTPRSPLPERLGSWELEAQVATQQAYAQAQAAAAAVDGEGATPMEQRRRQQEMRRNLALLQRKGATGVRQR
jgi:hypothetical protein